MGLDARIPLMAQGINIEPRSNALMRAAQLQGTQDTNALRQMQMQQLRQAAEQSMMERQAAAQKEARMAEVLRGLQPVNGTQANRVSGVTGPRPEAAAVIGQRPQVDPMQLLQAGFDPKMVEFIMNSPNLGRPEVARTVEVAGANGSPETRQFDKFGQPVGASLPKPVQRQMANAGGSLVPYNPYTQADPIGVTLTPGQIQSDATARRGQNMTDARARMSAEQSLTKPFEVTGPEGTPILVQQDKQGNLRRVDGFGPKTGASKPMTEGQAKANLFGTRMQAAEKVFEAMAEKGVNRPGLIKETAQGVAGAFPLIGDSLKAGAGVATNWTQSSKQQQIEQAQRDFVNAVLRRESGAVISDPEFANATQQYFPQIGDSDEVIAQKKANRATAIEGVLAEVPPGARKQPPKSGNVTVDY